ncbi:deoxyribodipyrimidine photo-lyase-like [Neoarius graeffei]|uniref:deoxyribodipyrimidine photo-lyase-like n=1 Tax=Neoarius graeffei TaxID=443677 RepID=UPI00298C2818|nr:deoxyribodipyrimidine photo-lyase-like [Neoarius graeffei]
MSAIVTYSGLFFLTFAPPLKNSGAPHTLKSPALVCRCVAFSGAYDWAKKTLQDHAKDARPYLYTREQLENADTHDQLWNAAQRQLVLEGKMQGFMRMYWAKKILEWTASPEEAVNISIYLNDRYSLDGCDPSGYVGCMWSICGIHDQGWSERPVFGKVRYMNYAGCKRKFDVGQFERRYAGKKA